MHTVPSLPHIVLFQPEIPPNTGNVIRLCANSGAELHLIEPLGFSLDEKKVRRAGLGHREFVRVGTWPSWKDYQDAFVGRRFVMVETTGTVCYSDFCFDSNDSLVFGSEGSGIPPEVLLETPRDCVIAVPMLAGSRSLNLSNTVAIVVYEAWRQMDYVGAEGMTSLSIGQR